MPTTPTPAAPAGPVAQRSPLWRELLIVGTVYALYSVIRNAAPTRVLLAQDHAHAVLRLERHIGLDIEHGVNAYVAATKLLAVPVNYYYATLHFILTAGVLVWLYLARPGAFVRARRVLLVMTLLGLVGYWLYPLAPPRLTPGAGFVDTSEKFHTWGALASHAAKTVSNQYAAMPSMHVGWALWSGLSLALFARRRFVRLLGALHPVLTFLVVMGTGHHFVLDAVGAIVAFSLALSAAWAMGRFDLWRTRGARPAPAELGAEDVRAG